MSYNLVLDEPVNNDLVEEQSGLKFIVDQALYDSSQGFTISSVKQNGLTYYRVLPQVEVTHEGGCSACPSCG
ncbi:MAG: hypothetical protein VB084_10130 [Syntrophomonadaceae bacterium]|nr:hypothetical protein [Syntrophomonadaceae bacterium]